VTLDASALVAILFAEPDGLVRELGITIAPSEKPSGNGASGVAGFVPSRGASGVARCLKPCRSVNVLGNWR
jgi:hypothetical protein